MGMEEYLSGELSRLHYLTASRHEVQLQFMNRQIHDLKHGLYHASIPGMANAFNGQFSKQKIFADLCNAFPFDVFIETGTYLGVTTQFLARRGKPVHSVEINEECFQKAKALLRDEALVNLELGNSLKFLSRLTESDLAKRDLVFIYLDSHWYDHLPLREEIALIAKNHPRAVVMIDDFKIEDDEGYGYDSYDDAQEVTLAFLKEELRQHHWQIFFPSMPSAQDHITNDILPPRGTAVITCDPEFIPKLQRIVSLRHWP